MVLKNSAFKLFLAIILILFAINIIYFNDVCADVALVMDYASSIVKDGKPIIGLWSNLFSNSGYNFTYFPLFPFIVGIIIKLIGYKYAALKIASLFFYFANITVLYYLCRKLLPFWISSLIILAYSLDPLIISDTMSGLYGSFFGFMFLSLFILYKKGRIENKALPKLIGGSLAGFTGITHLLGIVWTISIFPLVKIFDFIFKKDKKIKLDTAFILPFLFIIFIFGLWIFLDIEKWNVFNLQVLSNITDKRIYLPLHQSLFKAILNPVADFYLAFFRHYSFLPAVIMGVLFYTIFKFRENYYNFFFLFIPLISLIFLLRTESYLVMIGPTVYAILTGICIENNNCKNFKFSYNYIKVIKRGLVCIFLFYFIFNTFQLLHRPSLNFDKRYYAGLLETKTEKGSNIVTDPVLFLSATGGRKVYSVAILIYYWFRNYYSYEDLLKSLSPDYIILTERMKRWGETKDKFNQRKKFQTLLKEEFVLKDVVKNSRYGDVWIYKSKINYKY